MQESDGSASLAKSTWLWARGDLLYFPPADYPPQRGNQLCPLAYAPYTHALSVHFRSRRSKGAHPCLVLSACWSFFDLIDLKLREAWLESSPMTSVTYLPGNAVPITTMVPSSSSRSANLCEKLHERCVLYPTTSDINFIDAMCLRHQACSQYGESGWREPPASLA